MCCRPLIHVSGIRHVISVVVRIVAAARVSCTTLDMNLLLCSKCARNCIKWFPSSRIHFRLALALEFHVFHVVLYI